MSDKVVSEDWQEKLKDLENKSIFCILKIISLFSLCRKILSFEGEEEGIRGKDMTNSFAYRNVVEM
ncbi:hypothetical protein [Bartonella queenslandensis]|uniref:hypothetical protein n=1 Tax=Bartonella queenslandensis TaxID=481138 RepID=UPI001BAC7FAE|nr:hypothetical protein [Bartonella queenslandensis]